MILTYLGKRNYKGTSKDGKAYNFDRLAFLDTQPSDSVVGSFPMICVPTSGLDYSNLVPGREYDVHGMWSKGNYYVNVILEV